MLQANSHGKVKEMNKLLALLFGLTLSLPSAHAEITSESFLFEVFDGCIEEPMEDTTLCILCVVYQSDVERDDAERGHHAQPRHLGCR
jgi:hypothetical protein